MPLIGTTEMFKKAYEGHYAIGAFNINNMEIVQAVTEAAAELKSPIILQASAGARKYAKPSYLKHLVAAALEDYDLPIALHLDHGADFETCKDCIDSGFTSVMIDGSKHSFEDNIALTKKVVEYAHSKGVVVEGELGQLAGIGGRQHGLSPLLHVYIAWHGNDAPIGKLRQGALVFRHRRPPDRQDRCCNQTYSFQFHYVTPHSSEKYSFIVSYGAFSVKNTRSD